MFGRYVRWQVDMPPPDDAVPARMALTTVDVALRHATGASPGPVHLNCQLREPLGPRPTDWRRAALKVHCCCALLCDYKPGVTTWCMTSCYYLKDRMTAGRLLSGLLVLPVWNLTHSGQVAPLRPCLASKTLCNRICCLLSQGLERWEASSLPYTQGHVPLGSGGLADSPGACIPALLTARRGLLVVGELPRAEDAVAALRIAAALGWPVVCDILSGMLRLSVYSPLPERRR